MRSTPLYVAVWWFMGGMLGAAAPDLDREIILAPHGGDTAEDREIGRWQERVRELGKDPTALERLAWAYVAKARQTQDAGYYKLAEKTVDVMDRASAPAAPSDLLRGHVLHNLHRFREAEVVARRLVQSRGLPTDRALLCDLLLEQGKVPEAVTVLQRLVDEKPGLETYSRISYVRWLHGDVAGAFAAMADAERAGAPQAGEARTWTIVRMAGLALQLGDATRARALAESALARMPDYPPALLARGRALLALARPTEAVPVLERAAELNPLPEYQWCLVDALNEIGDAAGAERHEARLRTHGETSDPRTFALYLATSGNAPETAQRLARAELTRRADVVTHDAVAWAAFAAGDLTAAEAEMRAALALGTRDARLFWHAGEIFRARGDERRAADYLARALPMAGTLMPSERRRLESAAGHHAAAP